MRDVEKECLLFQEGVASKVQFAHWVSIPEYVYVYLCLWLHLGKEPDSRNTCRVVPRDTHTSKLPTQAGEADRACSLTHTVHVHSSQALTEAARKQNLHKSVNLQHSTKRSKTALSTQYSSCGSCNQTTDTTSTILFCFSEMQAAHSHHNLPLPLSSHSQTKISKRQLFPPCYSALTSLALSEDQKTGNSDVMGKAGLCISCTYGQRDGTQKLNLMQTYI